VHTPELTVAEKEVPEMQLLQTVSEADVHAADLYSPAGHLVHTLQLGELLLAEKASAGHAEQVESDVKLHSDVTYWPEVHVVHGVHSVCELDVHGLDAYFPIGHVMQVAHSDCERKVLAGHSGAVTPAGQTLPGGHAICIDALGQ
jgi:hypothetical protein